METVPAWVVVSILAYLVGWAITCVYITKVKGRVDKRWAVPVYTLLSLIWFAVLPMEVFGLLDD